MTLKSTAVTRGVHSLYCLHREHEDHERRSQKGESGVSAPIHDFVTRLAFETETHQHDYERRRQEVITSSN